MTTESQAPSGTVSAGMAVEVMPRTAEAEVASGAGVLASVSGFSIFVEVGKCPWSAGDDVIVACGPLGNRVGALARFREARSGRAVFVRQSPWRPLNRRAFERVPAELAAEWASGDEWRPGIVADVSHGGLALVVTSEPSTDSIRVCLNAAPRSTTVTGRIVGRSGATPAAVLHLQFEPLSEGSRRFLGDLIARLALSLGEGESPD